MPHLVQIELPYDLSPKDLILEPRSEPRSLNHNLQWLVSYGRDEEEVERILRAAVCLYRYDDNSPSFADCVDTAIMWERG